MFEECRLEERHELTSGASSPYFYDFELLSRRELEDYCVQLSDLVPPSVVAEIDFIAAPILGGVEVAFVVACEWDKPLVKVSTVEKTTRGPKVSGKYLVVDDVVSTFQAVNRTKAILCGYEYMGVAALIYRGTETPGPDLWFLDRKEAEEHAA